MRDTLIITDLDGTLLNNKNEISRLNEKWIKKFMAVGGLFTFATGRMEKTALPYADLLKVDLPLITYNGAKLYCTTTDLALYEKTLKIQESAWEVITETNKNKERGVFIYSEGKPFILERNNIVDEFENKEKVQCILKDRNHFINKPVTKVLIIMKDVPSLHKVDQKIKNDPLECETVFSELNYLEILPKEVSKGNGLTELIKYLDRSIPLRTIAFGDNLNDIPLLETAEIGVAVQNAQPELKAVSDIVTTQSNEEDAIAHVIQNILFEDKDEFILNM